MKGLFITVYSIALTCNFALAQGTDAALARIDQKESSITKTAVAETDVSGAKEITKGEEASTTRAGFVVPIKKSAASQKVGPNGEELIMKRNKFYYLNEDGKKVKVKSSSLKDMPKSS